MRMTRDWNPLTLTSRERRILGALAEGLYDPKGSGEVRLALGHVLGEVEAWLAALDLTSRAALRAYLVVLELSPIRHGFGARRMSRLSLDERTHYLAVLDAGGASELIVWKTLVGAAYFAHPRGEQELRAEPAPRARIATVHRVAGRQRRRVLPLVGDARGAR